MTTTKKQSQQRLIELRRASVLELLSKGYTQADISRKLNVSTVMICRDVNAITVQSKEKIQRYIEVHLPNEYEKCLVGITAILKESFEISQEPDIERREKIAALSLAKDCYSIKLNLITGVSVLGDAINFITKHQLKQQQQVAGDKKQKDSISRILQSPPSKTNITTVSGI